MGKSYSNTNKNPPDNGENKDIKTHEFNSYYSSYNPNGILSFDLFDYYSAEQISGLVRDPMGNNKLLRDVSLLLYGTNGSLTNTIDYITAMPTLDKVIITHGDKPNKKKKNKALMESTLRTIKDKEVIRDALFKGMIEGEAFYYFETTKKPLFGNKYLNDFDVSSIVEINDLGMNASVISLPTDYTEIVGIKNNSYVIAFDLGYFDEPMGETVERKLKKFPKEIRDAYYKHKENPQKIGNWVVLDNDKTIVHKIRSKRDEKYGRPIVLAAINDILYGDYFTKTKRNVLDEINNKIVYETFPEGRDKGTSALTKAQQEKQHETVKNAVINKNNRGGISFFSVAAGTKINAIDSTNTDIFDEKNEANLNDKISLDLGLAGSLLNGVGAGSYSSQQNNLELITGELFQWIEQITSEINKCVNKNVIKDKKNYAEASYLPITHTNQKTKVEFYKQLYLQGNGSLTAWIASCGINPDAYYALLDQELESGIYEKYQPHVTSYTFSANANKSENTGRPTSDDPSDRTIQSRANGGNDIPSPSDNK